MLVKAYIVVHDDIIPMLQENLVDNAENVGGWVRIGGTNGGWHAYLIRTTEEHLQSMVPLVSSNGTYIDYAADDDAYAKMSADADAGVFTRVNPWLALVGGAPLAPPMRLVDVVLTVMRTYFDAGFNPLDFDIG